MTKRDIARRIAEGQGINTTQAVAIIQQVFNGIVDTLVNEGRIELRNFGVFEVRKRKCRQARNPRTGEQVCVPERLVVTFKPGREMAERVAQLIEVPRQSHAVMSGAGHTGVT